MDEESTAWTQDLRSEEMDWWTCSTYLNAENSPEKTNKTNKYPTTVEMLKDYRGDSSDQDYGGGGAQSQAPGEC